MHKHYFMIGRRRFCVTLRQCQIRWCFNWFYVGAFDCHGIKRPNSDEFGNICVSITSLKVEVSTVNFQYFRAVIFMNWEWYLCQGNQILVGWINIRIWRLWSVIINRVTYTNYTSIDFTHVFLEILNIITLKSISR